MIPGDDYNKQIQHRAELVANIELQFGELTTLVKMSIADLEELSKRVEQMHNDLMEEGRQKRQWRDATDGWIRRAMRWEKVGRCAISRLININSIATKKIEGIEEIEI